MPGSDGDADERVAEEPTPEAWLPLTELRMDWRQSSASKASQDSCWEMWMACRRVWAR